MSSTKIYDSTKKQWVVIASSNADQICVRDSELLPTDLLTTNVEAVLVDHELRIKKAEGNIAWLALHGGGGSSSGGGDGSSSVSAEITVNGLTSGSSVTYDASVGLYILVLSSSSSVKWSITASTGTGKTISSVTKVTSLQVTGAMLSTAGQKSTFTLSVVAFNEDSLDTVYWNGTILIPDLEISGNDVSYNYSTTEYPENESITLNYQIDSATYCNLYINDEKIDEFSKLYSLLNGSIVITLEKLKSYGVTLAPGLTAIKIKFENSNNTALYSETTVHVTLLTSTPTITCSSLSVDNTSPTELGLYTDVISVLVPFTVWYSGTSYVYQIKYSKDGNFDEEFSFSTYLSYNVELSNATVLIQNASIGDTYTIRIYIKDSVSGVIYHQDFYISLVLPASSLIDDKITPIFDFCTFNMSISNGQYSNNGYTIGILNLNTKSSVIQSETRSLRLLNASYATIDVSGIKSRIVKSNVLLFSLNIQYKVDYHPDDERTVFQWGSLNSNKTSSNGILIRDHDLYLHNRKIMSLEDQELIDITITYKSQGTSPGYAFIYIDGAPEIVESYEPSGLFYAYSNDDNYPIIYIGASADKDETFNYIDMNLYRCTLYDKCLSPYEVLIEHLNNEARAKLSNGTPDTTLITDGLKRNFITSDEDSTSDTDITIGTKKLTSSLYSSNITFDNNSDDLLSAFNLSTFVVNIDNSLQLNPLLLNASIPLPIVFIDMSSGGWRWSDFITPGAASLSTTSATFWYYDLSLNPSLFIKLAITTEPQGTSTLADYIKNLNIIFPDDVLFSPRSGWFPELIYTLKADIVDSSHSLNPAIGRFINEEFGYDTETGGSKWYPFSETVLSTFQTLRNKTNSPLKTYFPKATIKHGVEGFPVMVLIAFAPEAGSSDYTLKSLGIYLFILGRNSPRNLGYEIITGVSGIDSTIIYPFLSTTGSLTTTTIPGYWFEFNENDSYGNDEDFQGLANYLNQGSTSQWKAFDFKGAFWLNSNLYYNKNVDIKYSNLGNQKVSNVSDFKPFMNFVEAIQQCPVSIRRRTAAASTVANDTTTLAYKELDYLLVTDSSGNESYQWVDTGNQVSIATTTDAVLNLVYDLTARPTSPLNLDSIGRFLPPMMMFGSLDNFQKNMPVKFYRRNDGTWEPGLLGIYDTDTGIGLDNQAGVTIDEAMWLCGLVNSGNGYIESHTGTNSTIVGNSNKLWTIDTPALIQAYKGGTSGSIFATAWNDMKRVLIELNKAINSIDELADYFYNNYFLPLTEGCGELLFSLTYIAKYITKYTTGSGSSLTNQIAKLHGRRKYQVKHWLKNRIQFLNSMFNAMGFASGETAVDSTSEASLNAVLGPSCNVTMNAPIITKYSNQGNVAGWMFCDRNVETSLYFGSDSLTSDPAKSHSIQYPENIIKLGTGDHPLYDIGFNTINSGSLPYLTEFNTSVASRSASNLNVLGTMNADFMMDHFRKINTDGTKGISELRTIDFRNTYPYKENTYNLNLSTGFEKLLDLYINDSCISSITFPQDVPLRDFDVSGSKLTSLTIENQSFISKLDLTDCDELMNVTMNNCSNIKNFEIGTTNIRLDTVNISSDALETIKVTNGSISKLSIISTGLLTVKISSSSITELSLGAIRNLSSIDVSNCIKLTSLSLSFDDSSISEYTNLTTLNLSNTKVSVISINGKTYDLLDLSLFTGLTDFNIQNNSVVKEIQFANNKTKAITINKEAAFTGCTLLERVYGHLSLLNRGLFQNCRYFSIHGSDLSTMTWLGKSVLSGDEVLMPYQVLGMTTSTFTSSQLWLSGTKVTNFDFDSTDGSQDFYGTACTIFDAYYFFSNPGSITNCSEMFRESSNTYGKFGGFASISNSPNENMFHWATKIVNYDGMFYGGSSRYIVLKSPSYAGSTTSLNSDGLFSLSTTEGWGIGSLLTGSTVNLSKMFYGYNIIADRNLFRANGSSAKPIGDIGYFEIRLVVDNSRTITYDEISSALSDVSYLETNKDKFGNLKDFFNNLGNLYRLFGCINTRFINYELTNESLILPLGLTYIQYSFVSQYSYGEIKFSDYFNTTGALALKSIYNSFRVNYSTDTLKTYFKIKAGMFDSFVNIVNIGYYNQGDYAVTSPINSSFTGDGLTKTIEGSFPFDLFKKCTKLQMCTGFFLNTTADSTDTSLKLPGELFEYNSLLQRIDYLFYNFKSSYQLSTNRPFRNCKNLSTCSYAFALEATNSIMPVLTGSIPKLFFYTGSTTKTLTLLGNNVYKFEIVYTYDSDGNITGSEIKGYNSDGTEASMGILTTTLSDVIVPNTSITDMSYVFQHSNLDVYQNTSPTIEPNDLYSPYLNVYNNSSWSVNNSRNTNKYSYMWEYDGINKPVTSSYSGTFESYDEYNEDTCTIDKVEALANTSSIAGSPNYCCPPDLFRYCTSNCNVEGVFNQCGTSGWTSSYNDGFNIFAYGIQGRIPPHLLKPLSNTTSIRNMFRYCRKLNCYKKSSNNKSYYIPSNFFNYATGINDLSGAFTGCCLPYTVDLAVFGSLTKALNVSDTFYRCCFNATSANRASISNVFSGNTISNLTRVFALSASLKGQEDFTRSQYVTFSNMFKSNVYNKEGSYGTNMDYSFAFNGYSSSTVVHEDPMTLCNNSTTCNYGYSDGTIPS